MGAALRLILAAASRRAGVFGDHARARAGHLALLAGFGATAAGFLIALATVALADWLGLIPALAIMAGIALIGCGGVLIAMQAEARAHAAALARQQRAEAQAMQAAAFAAVPAIRWGGGLVAVAATGLAAALAIRRGGGRRG